MLPAFALPIVLAQLASGPLSPARPGRATLRAAAAASPRPPECAPPGSGRHRSLWDRAHAPGLVRYCDALARGYAELRHSPGAALAAAGAADKAAPGHAAPHVLEGRALLAAGKPARAFQSFERASKLSRRALRSPGALHDLAVAALRSGHTKEALHTFRALVPSANLLGATERQRVYVEAAALVMARARRGSTRRSGI